MKAPIPGMAGEANRGAGLSVSESPGAQFAAAGLHKELLIIDTPAGSIDDVGEALALADFAVMVVRPTLLDLAGLARTLTIVRRLRKASTISSGGEVLNT